MRLFGEKKEKTLFENDLLLSPLRELLESCEAKRRELEIAALKESGADDIESIEHSKAGTLPVKKYFIFANVLAKIDQFIDKFNMYESSSSKIQGELLTDIRMLEIQISPTDKEILSAMRDNHRKNVNRATNLAIMIPSTVMGGVVSGPVGAGLGFLGGALCSSGVRKESGLTSTVAKSSSLLDKLFSKSKELLGSLMSNILLVDFQNYVFNFADEKPEDIYENSIYVYTDGLNFKADFLKKIDDENGEVISYTLNAYLEEYSLLKPLDTNDSINIGLVTSLEKRESHVEGNLSELSEEGKIILSAAAFKSMIHKDTRTVSHCKLTTETVPTM